MHVCFVLFLFCLPVCVCVKLQVPGPLWAGSAFRPGASGLPYYCAPLVCVPAVLGELAVWQHNKPKTKNQHSGDFVASRDQRSRSVAIQIDTAELVSQTATLHRPRALLPATIGVQSISGTQALPGTQTVYDANTACLLPTCHLLPPPYGTPATSAATACFAKTRPEVARIWRPC